MKQKRQSARVSPSISKKQIVPQASQIQAQTLPKAVMSKEVNCMQKGCSKTDFPLRVESATFYRGSFVPTNG